MVEIYYLFFANLQNKNEKSLMINVLICFCVWFEDKTVFFYFHGCVIYLVFIVHFLKISYTAIIFISFLSFPLPVQLFLPLPFPLKFMTSLILSYIPMYTQKHTVLRLLALLTCICG